MEDLNEQAVEDALVALASDPKLTRPKKVRKKAAKPKKKARKAAKKPKSLRAAPRPLVRTERMDLRLSKKEKAKVLAKAKAKKSTATAIIAELIEKMK